MWQGQRLGVYVKCLGSRDEGTEQWPLNTRKSRVTCGNASPRGSTPPGTQLPLMRDIAAAHGVSDITVRKAYALLTREGLVESRRSIRGFREGTPRPRAAHGPRAAGRTGRAGLLLRAGGPALAGAPVAGRREDQDHRGLHAGRRGRDPRRRDRHPADHAETSGRGPWPGGPPAARRFMDRPVGDRRGSFAPRRYRARRDVRPGRGVGRPSTDLARGSVGSDALARRGRGPEDAYGRSPPAPRRARHPASIRRRRRGTEGRRGPGHSDERGAVRRRLPAAPGRVRRLAGPARNQRLLPGPSVRLTTSIPSSPPCPLDPGPHPRCGPWSSRDPTRSASLPRALPAAAGTGVP
ncbi:hypothetical protein B7R87_33055 (plasmid) [Streptomyces tsukubensis]|nr:hypothetical protein B7R87_33055 [Streptomyces tsukubensis]